MLLLVGAMGLETTCFADLAAIDVTSGGSPLKVSPTAQTTQGWEFVANRAITVTRLGLYDGPNSGALAGDEFLVEHPIGLWRLADGSLLTSGTIPSGTGADTELLDGFRYIDVDDDVDGDGVTLVAGDSYVVGFYTGHYSDAASADGMLVWPQFFTWSADSAIQYVSARWGDFGPDLALPSHLLDASYSRFGPNFQFIETVVPVPGAVLLGIIGLSCAGWRLRRRTP
jgi:hypothetical protein